MSNEKRRDSGIELLRIVLCFFVILIHTRISAYYDEHKLLDSIAKTVWFLSNSCFFIISGYYALSSKKLLEEDGVKKFYLKKISTIVLPLVIYSVLYVIIDYSSAGEQIISRSFFTDYITRLLSNKISFHMWFMYSLLGRMLAVPLLVFAFKYMPPKSCNIIFVIATVLLQLKVLLSDFNISLGIDFILGGWLLIFCIGWFAENRIDAKNEKWLYIAGILGFIITVPALCYLPQYKNATDFALPHILFSLSVFVLFKRHVNIKGKIIGRIISFVSKYTFSIYLVHIAVIRSLPSKYLPKGIDNAIVNHLVKSFIFFIVSFVIAIIVDNIVIRPLKYLAVKLFKFLSNIILKSRKVIS